MKVERSCKSSYEFVLDKFVLMIIGLRRDDEPSRDEIWDSGP